MLQFFFVVFDLAQCYNWGPGALPHRLSSLVSSSLFLCENAQEIGWLSPSLKTSRVHKVSWSPGTWLSYKEYCCHHCPHPHYHQKAQAILLQLPKIGKGKYFNLDAEPKLQVLERSHKVPTLFQILQQILSWVLS